MGFGLVAYSRTGSFLELRTEYLVCRLTVRMLLITKQLYCSLEFIIIYDSDPIRYLVLGGNGNCLVFIAHVPAVFLKRFGNVLANKDIGIYQ